MNSSSKTDSLFLTGLLTLCIVPALAGMIRLLQINRGVVTEENARFLAAPWPVAMHIVGAVVFCVLGAFQFAPGLRRRWPQGHRIAGRILVPCGLTASLTGLWMTQFYPSVGFDGPALYWIRLLVGSMMTFSIVLAVDAIRKRNIKTHRAWMIRAYALGMGAGTQVITHLPWFLLPSFRSESFRAILMAAGWGINLALAEWIIRRRTIAPIGPIQSYCKNDPHVSEFSENGNLEPRT